MARDDEGGKPGTGDGDWVEVGKRPARVAAPAADVAAIGPEDEKPFEARESRPPWKYSVYTGVAGLILMGIVYVFPDLRSFETPWDDEFPTVYSLLPFPILGLVWGIVGAIGKQYRADAGRALIGIVLSLAGLGIAYSGVLQNPRTPEPDATTDPRLQMTPQELKEWRSEKLRQ